MEKPSLLGLSLSDLNFLPQVPKWVPVPPLPGNVGKPSLPALSLPLPGLQSSGTPPGGGRRSP